MVLSFALELVSEITVATVKYTYSWGRYFVYGKEDTLEEKIDKLLLENKEIQKELIELKNTRGIAKSNDDSKEICQPSRSSQDP